MSAAVFSIFASGYFFCLALREIFDERRFYAGAMWLLFSAMAITAAVLL